MRPDLDSALLGREAVAARQAAEGPVEALPVAARSATGFPNRACVRHC
jgi:hypothetical protein